MKFYEFGKENEKTLVLLHGFATTWEQSFRPLIDVAQNEFHIIAMAMDGFNPDEPEKDAVFVVEEARMLADYLVEHTGGKADIIYGASMGGMVLTDLLLDDRITVTTAIADGYTVMQYPAWLPQGLKRRLAKMLAGMMFWLINKHKPLIARAAGVRSLDELDQMMYTGMTKQTMVNSEYGLMDYRYKHEAFQRADSHIWYGEKEKGVSKTVCKLKSMGIAVKDKSFPGLGHGSLLLQPERLLDEIRRAYLQADEEGC